jgi:hypothetical protein
VPVAYDPSNYINGVDQRTVAQQRKDEKADAKKSAAKLKEGMRKRILNVKTKSPSATDVQSGKVSGAVKSNKSKTTAKETAMNKSKSMDKMPARKMPEGAKFPAAKKAAVKKAVEKKVVKAAAKKLVGPAAVKALQDRVSPAGVKKAEAGAKKAIDKKYPGLYKK